MSGFRRTWDVQAYEEKARVRLESGDHVDSVEGPLKKSKKEEFQAAEENAAGPMGSERAFIQARKAKIDVESKVGKTEVVDPTNLEKGAGYWCEVCACLLKDSKSYLDHINGKKHQRALGFSMRVERADADKVKSRLDQLKASIHTKSIQPTLSSIEQHDQRIATVIAEQEEKKRKRKEEKAKKELQVEKELETADPEIAALMGFTGFSSALKK